MSKKQTAAEHKAPPATPPGLPLFFRDPRAIDASRHAHAAVRPGSAFDFARHTNSIPLNTIEFMEAARYYPIVFTYGDTPSPVAIVGLERENYFVEADHSWKKNVYIPAYVRQYPFVFFEKPEEKKFYLCIDEGSPHFSPTLKEGAQPLYQEDGKPAAITDNALKFCTAFYNHYLITRHFCTDLKAHNLLVPYQSEAKLSDGRKISLAGFQMIDEKALNELPDQVFLEFRKKGWLPFLYFSLASTSNWKRLTELA
jgi:hypothetical protein